MRTLKLGNVTVDRDEVIAKLSEHGYSVEKKKPAGRFIPGIGDYYWGANGPGAPRKFKWTNDIADRDLLARGNVSRTEEECLASVAKEKALIRIQDKYQEFLDEAEVVLDWADGNQEKFNLYYNHDTKRWELTNSWRNQFTNMGLHSTEKGCIWVRDNMKYELNLIWGIGVSDD